MKSFATITTFKTHMRTELICCILHSLTLLLIRTVDIRHCLSMFWSLTLTFIHSTAFSLCLQQLRTLGHHRPCSYQYISESHQHANLLNIWVMLACICDKLQNGVTYSGEILHADPLRLCNTWAGSDVDMDHHFHLDENHSARGSVALY